jgi:hypothetical protein
MTPHRRYRLRWALLLVLLAGAMQAGYPAQAQPDARCDAFGVMAAGQSLPAGVSAEQVRQRFVQACSQFANVAAKNGDVHWWQGLLVQDFLGAAGQENGAILYDVNSQLGGGQAYVLWGPVLARYWSNPAWGPPVSHRTEAARSRYNGGTRGHYVQFQADLTTYYNARKQATYVLRGVTRTRFETLAGSAGLLGFPESEGLVAANSGHSGMGGWYQYFEGGIVHTFQLGGVWQAWEVRGAIQATYNSLPGTGSGSQLGFPISGEIETPASAAPSQKVGVYQKFEGGFVYYDAIGAGGTTFVLYNNVLAHLSPNYSESNVDNPVLGFPIGKMRDRSDCQAFFEAGYIDCRQGIRAYDANLPRPPFPSGVHLPFSDPTVAYYKGGPHAYGRGPSVRDYSAANGTGSGIDLGNGGNFPVTAMTSGTVVDVLDQRCNADGNLGCRVAIRSDYGGAVIVYGHLVEGSITVRRFNSQAGILEEHPITKGMWIGRAEHIGTAGNSGTGPIHLHLELLDGTARACPAGWTCYRPAQGPRLGVPASWGGVDLENYRLFAAQDAANTALWMNYEGTAVRREPSGLLRAKVITTTYLDLGATQRALATVHADFPCDNEACWNNALDPGRTVFSVLGNTGCLGPNCPDLFAQHGPSVLSFDPENLTLASPSYGPELSHWLYLPMVLR